MQDNSERELTSLFSQANEALPSAEFTEIFLAKLQRARRARNAWLIVAAVAALILAAWVAPTVLSQTASAMRAATEYAVPYGPLLVSPLGWAVSTFIGLLVLMRVGVLRRHKGR